MTAFITLDEAAARVQDGSTFALGGMALYRSPVGFVRGLLQRDTRPQSLTLLSFTAGYAADLLIGARVVDTVRSVYVGLEVFGFAPMFTARANRGDITVMEETETSIVLGLRARAAGVGFLPSVAWQGTDLLTLRPDVKNITDPYTGETLTAFPAIGVDVAVIHGLAADRAGNVAINNNLAIDELLVYAADTVIATVERIVERLTPQADQTIIPYPGVDAVVELPGGAAPTSCYPYYPLKGRELARYVEAASSESGFAAYLADLNHT